MIAAKNNILQNRMQRRPQGKPFTLLEIIVAVTISALLMTGLLASFRGIFVIRETNAEYSDCMASFRTILNRFENDISAVVPPGNNGLAGDLVGTSDATTEGSTDTLEFSASVNRFHAEQFGGDVVKVRYELLTDDDGDTGLVRSLWANPLALQQEDAQETLLVHTVSSLEFEYYDGSEWLSTWDTSLQDGKLPNAVRLSVGLDGKAMEKRSFSTLAGIDSEQAIELSQGGNSAE